MTNNKLLIKGAEQVIDMMKMEIAQEMGIELGAETSARDNGKVGGEMTKRLVQIAKEQLAKEYLKQKQEQVKPREMRPMNIEQPKLNYLPIPYIENQDQHTFH
jgi:hypothetical protein